MAIKLGISIGPKQIGMFIILPGSLEQFFPQLASRVAGLDSLLFEYRGCVCITCLCL
jgi:hypothetical protein